MLAYFITLCAYQSQPLFGALTNGLVKLTDAGHIVEGCWLDVPDHEPQFQIVSYMVMPNHFHGIIIQKAASDNRSPSAQDPRLSNTIRSFKAAATLRVNHLHGTPGAHLWQPSYHARQIMSEAALNRLSQYVENNPAAWLDDPLNPNGLRPAPFCPVPLK